VRSWSTITLRKPPKHEYGCLLSEVPIVTSMRKLNLGCGEDKKEGYVNVDIHDHVKPDVVHDLNIFPYPFQENEFDVIEAFHVLEHLDKPFPVMKELQRILKPSGILHIKVPHFSRGFTHAQHSSGYDVTFPYYFDSGFTKSGYFGVPFELEKLELHWMAFFHLLRPMGASIFTISALKLLNVIFSFLANLSPRLCSRIWCFWVGGFEEIEFIFRKPPNRLQPRVESKSYSDFA
jgi:SAM-dependent methyltransferase